MSHTALGGDANLRVIFPMIPDLALPMIDCYQQSMRGPSILSPGERELIYAYTSAQSGCHFCAFSHQHCAIGLGIAASVFDVPREQINRADLSVDTRERLALACALYNCEASAEALFTSAAAHQTMGALADTVRVVALTVFMNRFIDGLGAYSPDESHVVAGTNLAAYGYLRVRADIERSIGANGGAAAQTLPGQSAKWADSPDAFGATVGWLTALEHYLFSKVSGVPVPLRKRIWDGVTCIDQSTEATNAREDGLLDFAVAVGTTPWRSKANDFVHLRQLGWSDDRDILDAVTIAALAAANRRLAFGMQFLPTSKS